MTDAQLHETLEARRTALAESAKQQAAELKARQIAGTMAAGPWVPTTKLGNRKRVKLPTRGHVAQMPRTA